MFITFSSFLFHTITYTPGWISKEIIYIILINIYFSVLLWNFLFRQLNCLLLFSY